MMNRNVMFVGVMLFAGSCGLETVNAQVVRKTGQLILSTFTREGAEEAFEAAGTKVLREAGEAALQRSGKAIGQPLVGSSMRSAASTLGTKVAHEAGEHASKAAMRLTPRSARRLAMLEQELVASGQGPEVMSLLAKHGKADQLVDFLYRNKGTLATGTLLAAFIANPDGVLGATGEFGSTLIESSGKHIAQPLIKETAKPIINFIGSGLLLIGVILAALAGLGIKYRSSQKWVGRGLVGLMTRRS